MVYYRKRNYRRRAYRKKSNPVWNAASSGVKALTLATKAVRGINYIRGLVNSEMHKHLIQWTTPFDVTQLGYISALTYVPIANTSDSRTGDSILARKLMLRLTVLKSPLVGESVFRCYIVRDNQQVSDIVPNVSDVIEDTCLNTVNAPLAPLNNSTVGRFSILKSLKFGLTDNSPLRNIDVFMDMRSHIRFNGTSSVDYQKNHIYMVSGGR